MGSNIFANQLIGFKIFTQLIGQLIAIIAIFFKNFYHWWETFLHKPSIMITKMFPNKEVALNFFTKNPLDSTPKSIAKPNNYTCLCGSHIQQSEGSGWSNLCNHIYLVHKETWLDKMNGPRFDRNQSKLDSHFSIASDFAKNIYGWFDLLTSEVYLPFHATEQPGLLKYMTLKKLSR